MKMTYTELKNRHSNLILIGKMTLPRKVSVAIARNIVKFEKELDVYTKQRNDIADRYAKKDEAGNYITDNDNFTFDTEDDKTVFLQEMKELNETEIDVQVMVFKASDLDRCDEVERYAILSPVQEAAIEWMIDYGEEADLDEITS